MILSDFEKHDVQSWISRNKLVTPIAEFAVLLWMCGKNASPDEDMLRCADDFIALVCANLEGIQDEIFAHYQYFNEDWLKQCEVPAKLDRAGVLEFLRCPTLWIERTEYPAEPYICQVYFMPVWDGEHALRLQFVDGKWANQVAWWIWTLDKRDEIVARGR
jgi:hypothetical protein